MCSSATCPPRRRCWETSPTRPAACSNGTAAPSASPITKRPTSCCFTNIALRTNWAEGVNMTSTQSKFRAAIIGVAVLVSTSALAQDPRGSIAGRVIDKSDAVVAGARVQVINSQTGVSASARTNESGTFRIPFLLPGTYRLAAEMPGFKTYAQESGPLRVADSLDLTLRLETGATTETGESR